MTLGNGCLCVALGTHLTTPLKKRVVMGDNRIPEFEDLPTPLWVKGALRSEIDPERSSYEYEALKVKKGTLVLFHRNLMHKSVRPTRVEKIELYIPFRSSKEV